MQGVEQLGGFCRSAQLVEHAGQIQPLPVRPPGIGAFVLKAVIEGLLGEGDCTVRLSGLLGGSGQNTQCPALSGLLKRRIIQLAHQLLCIAGKLAIIT